MNPMNFDQAKIEKQLSTAIDTGMAVITTYGLQVVGAIVILILGWIVAGFVHRAILRSFARFSQIDQTIITFTASSAKYAVMVFTVIAVLSSVGVQTASFVAILGAMGLALGLALQGTLSHVASGFMLIVFRPFRVGDFIDAGGVSGTVREITLFATELATLENIKVFIPNGAVWGDVIKNFSGNPTRRIDVEIGISYTDSIDTAFAVAKDVVDANAMVLKEPAPVVAVSTLGDNAVNILVRVWVNQPDVLDARLALNKTLKEAFDKAGLTIPFPQRVIHHIHNQAPPAPTNN